MCDDILYCTITTKLCYTVMYYTTLCNVILYYTEPYLHYTHIYAYTCILVVLKLVPIPEHVYSCLCTHKGILILILIVMPMLILILYCTTLLLYYTMTLLDFILYFTVLEIIISCSVMRFYIA